MVLVASKQESRTTCVMSLSSIHRVISTWWFASKNCSAGHWHRSLLVHIES